MPAAIPCTSMPGTRRRRSAFACQRKFHSSISREPRSTILWISKTKDDTAKVKDMKDLMVTAAYQEGSDDAQLGDKFVSEVILGKNIMLSNDCKTCHKASEKSIGPAFDLVAKRYEKDPNAVNYLSQKIRKEVVRASGEKCPCRRIPALNEEDLRMIIGWIQSLSDANNPGLPAAGSLDPTLHKPVKD